MKFLHTIRQSFHSPEFYQEKKSEKVFHALGYFYSLAAALALVLTTIFSFVLIPRILSFVSLAGESIPSAIPNDIEVTLTNGRVSVNKQMPFVLPLPADLAKDFSSDNLAPPKNLLVIDTNTPSQKDAFVSADTFVLLTGDSLISGLKDAPDITNLAGASGTYKKEDVVSWIGGAKDLGKWLPYLVVFGGFVVFLFGFTGAIFWLLFAALIVLIIARFRKVPFTYAQAYVFGLYAASAQLLLVSLLFIFYPALLAYDTYMLFVIVAVVAWMNIKAPAASPTTSIVAADQPPQGEK